MPTRSQRRDQLVADQREAADDVGVTALGRLERDLEMVERGQQLLGEPAPRRAAAAAAFSRAIRLR